jgi:hypothetical protein
MLMFYLCFHNDLSILMLLVFFYSIVDENDNC